MMFLGEIEWSEGSDLHYFQKGGSVLFNSAQVVMMRAVVNDKTGEKMRIVKLSDETILQVTSKLNILDDYLFDGITRPPPIIKEIPPEKRKWFKK